ncbi:hypothetical protein Klosneuvirus_3_215 [Klosneuvirus KNV1]|uniref:Uncharacterized protein n=1 Tax=Klosneuvirus KNV1 TaxID=1977640 RepID=A0A1V0SK24_9VIRU|nr:hypothetical protein Klosneuvirus_3_215 [Klosneuvirus KNV1]
MHTELCRNLIRKFLDMILTNKIQTESIEAAKYVCDMVFENKLLDDKEFNDYFGTALVDLYSRYPMEMDKYVKRYGNFTKKLDREFKFSIRDTMRTVHFFYKYLNKDSSEYIPSHFQHSLLFLLNFMTQINDVLELSNNELNEITQLIEIFTMKDANQRQVKIYENKNLIINCIEKYLFHIVKIPASESYMKEYENTYNILIPDKWNRPDDKLIALIGFPQIEKDAMELFNDDNFLTDCMDAGANMIHGGFPKNIEILNTQDEFINKIKVKYPNIDNFLPYMKIEKGYPITGGEYWERSDD